MLSPETIQNFMWASEKRLVFAQDQISRIREQRDTGVISSDVWWSQYCGLKDKECIYEQDVKWCCEFLGIDYEERTKKYGRPDQKN